MHSTILNQLSKVWLLTDLHQVQIHLPARPQHFWKNILNTTMFENSKSCCIFSTKCDLVLFQVSWQNLLFFLCSFDFFLFHKKSSQNTTARDPFIHYCGNVSCWFLPLSYKPLFSAYTISCNQSWNKTLLEFPTIDYNCFLLAKLMQLIKTKPPVFSVDEVKAALRLEGLKDKTSI